jgi:hypothetical protein
MGPTAKLSLGFSSRLLSKGASIPEISGKIAFPGAAAANIPMWVAVMRAVPKTMVLVGIKTKTPPLHPWLLSLGD